MRTFEGYFKERIDWKFYNYLLDKATKYADEGYNINVSVFVAAKYKDEITYFSEVYDGSVYTGRDIDNGVGHYRGGGLFYDIEIQAPGKDSIIEEYYNEIKHMCVLDNKSKKNLKVKPLNEIIKK